MKQLEDMVMAELREMAQRPPIAVEMPPAVAYMLIAQCQYMLIAQCQLAARHPGNTGRSAEIVRDFIEGLRGDICKPGSAIDVSISMGYDQFNGLRPAV